MKKEEIKMVNSVPYTDILVNLFEKDKEFLGNFISAAFEQYNNDKNIENLVMALKCVTEAKYGVAALVEKTGLSRQTIYNTFSLKTSPNLLLFNKILNALGFEIKVVPIQKAC